MTVNWVDPCKVTTFVAQAIPNTFGFINADAVTILLPWLDDSTNQLYGQSTTSSLCGF
jgi:hypothetical protein